MTETTAHVSRKRNQRIERILRTAAEVFADRGFEGANLEEIAARLDMRGPSLYYYFSSKEELLLACLDQTAAAVTGRARELAEGPGSPRERLRLMLADQVLVQLRDYPEFISLFIRLQVPNPAVRTHIHDMRRAHGDLYRSVVEQGIATGDFAAVDSHRALLHAFGAIAYVQEWFHPDPDEDVTALAAQIADETLRLLPKP